MAVKRYVAIDLPQDSFSRDIQTRLGQALAALGIKSFVTRKLHITLAFLTRCNDFLLSKEIAYILENNLPPACPDNATYWLKSDAHLFGKNAVSLLVDGSKDPAGMRYLDIIAGSIRSTLLRHGLVVTDTFAPHVTFGRIMERSDIGRFRKMGGKIDFEVKKHEYPIESLTFHAGEFVNSWKL